MALTNQVFMPGADYQAICDAVRAKTGKTAILTSGELAAEIESITGGGGSADERVKYVTFMSEDGLTELLSYPVIVGTTCQDPVTLGLIETPTKEQTESQVFTYSGWSTTSGGEADASALTNVTEDRTVYVAFAVSVRTYTVRFFDGEELVNTEQVPYMGSSSYVYEKDGFTFLGWQPEAENVTADMDCYAQMEVGIGTLEETSWELISSVSEANEGENYWAVGDTKEITLNGTVGTLVLDNYTTYVYIIGFNHNSEIEGNGIHFGTFKTAQTDGKNVALVDSQYGKSSDKGTKYFSPNHWGSRPSGGWAACDLRYDVLGSTDTAPSGYGAQRVDGAIGYDASATTATQPVANTLMAALPADLRAVMKPMTKYTNNAGKVSENTEASAVTATVDYLPLLAEYEVQGAINKANSTEAEYQQRYAFFTDTDSMYKYKHSSISSSCNWLTRSPTGWYWISVNGTNNNGFQPHAAYGLAPIFKV